MNRGSGRWNQVRRRNDHGLHRCTQCGWHSVGRCQRRIGSVRSHRPKPSNCRGPWQCNWSALMRVGSSQMGRGSGRMPPLFRRSIRGPHRHMRPDHSPLDRFRHHMQLGWSSLFRVRCALGSHRCMMSCCSLVDRSLGCTAVARSHRPMPRSGRGRWRCNSIAQKLVDSSRRDRIVARWHPTGPRSIPGPHHHRKSDHSPIGRFRHHMRFDWSSRSRARCVPGSHRCKMWCCSQADRSPVSIGSGRSMPNRRSSSPGHLGRRYPLPRRLDSSQEDMGSEQWNRLPLRSSPGLLRDNCWNHRGRRRCHLDRRRGCRARA